MPCSNPAARGRNLTLADIQDLPAMLDLSTTARLLGISRSAAYRLAAEDALPAPVLRLGHTLRIPTAPLLAALGLTPPAATPAADPAGGGANGPGLRNGEHLDATG